MHGTKVEGAFLNLPGDRIAALPWESGAEDARTPNAGAWSADLAAREAFGVRPIYRRLQSGAGRPVVRDPNARSQGRGGGSRSQCTASKSWRFSRRAALEDVVRGWARRQ